MNKLSWRLYELDAQYQIRKRWWKPSIEATSGYARLFASKTLTDLLPTLKLSSSSRKFGTDFLFRQCSLVLPFPFHFF